MYQIDHSDLETQVRLKKRHGDACGAAAAYLAGVISGISAACPPYAFMSEGKAEAARGFGPFLHAAPGAGRAEIKKDG